MSDIPDGWTVVKPSASTSEVPDGWTTVKAAPVAAGASAPAAGAPITNSVIPQPSMLDTASDYANKFVDSAQGVADTAVHQGLGFVGQVLGTAPALGDTLVKALKGQEDNVSVPEKISNFTSNMLGDSESRMSNKGQEYNDWFNSNIAPSLPAFLGHMGGAEHGELDLKGPADRSMLEAGKAQGRDKMAQEFQGPQVPAGWTVVKPAPEAGEMAGPPRPPLQVTPEGQAFDPRNVPEVARQAAADKQAAAQEALDRSTAGITYENVPPDGTIPRSRPDGSMEVPKGNTWIPDENGIPVRQGMPTEPVNLAEQNINVDQSHVHDLGNAIQEANGPKLGPDETYGTGNMSGPMGAPGLPSSGTIRLPRSQRGAVDIQEVSDGLKIFVDGKQVGYLKDNLPRGMASKIGENANVDIVHLDPAYRGMGIGQKLYEAFSDRHDGRIMPSGKTSPSAWKLWNRNYPDKVDAFVQQEAGRITDGAPLEQVLSNVGDASVRRAIVEQVNPLKVLDVPRLPRSMRGGIDLEAVKKGLENLRGMRVDTPDGPGKVVGHRVVLMKDTDAIYQHLYDISDAVSNAHPDAPLEKIADLTRQAHDHWIETEQHKIPNDKPVGRYTVQMADGSTKGYFGDEIKKVYSGLSVANSQRGGIDVSAISDAVKRMKNMIDPNPMRGIDKPAFTKDATDILKKATGLDLIPKDPVPADVKAAILKEGAENGKIVLSDLRAGALMAGDQRGSALIQSAGRWVMNGVKRAELATQQYIHPVEQMLSRLVSKDMSSLASVFKDEMFSGMKHTDAQLVGRGLTDKQMAAYKVIRDMFSAALSSMNEARAKIDMEPITEREAYLSSRWGGRFRIPVYDTKGKLVWYIADTSKRGAQSALKYLQEKAGVDVDLTKSKLEVRGQNAQYMKDTRGALEDSYLTMLSQLDKNDPRVAGVKSIMEDAMSDHAYETLGQSKHFDPKANVRGFQGDQPWRSSAQNAYDLFKSQTTYARNAFQWAESQKAVANVKTLLADKDVQDLQPHNAEFVRQYVKNHLGFGENPIISAMEKWVSEKLGYDRSIAQEYVGLGKAIFLTQKLAANLGYYVSQGLQLMNALPEHGLYTGRGYEHNVLTTLARSQQDFAAGTIDHTMDVLSRGKVRTNVPMTKLGEDAWKYMEANGISQRNIFDEAGDMGQSVVGQGVHVLGKGIAMAEQLLRTNTFLQFAHHFDQSGKFASRSEMFREAEEATNRSMVDFRREERAQIFAKTGIVGSAASTLKSYLINYYNNMGRYGQEAMKGNPRSLMYALALQGGVYGVLNLPGAQEASDLIDLVKKALPDYLFNKVKDLNIKKMLIDLQGDWAYGGISKVTGAQLGSRGNVQIDNNFALDGMFPFITDQYKQAKAVAGAVVDPNATSMAQAAYSVAPAGVPQGQIASTKPFQGGERLDGTTVYHKPSKLDQHEYDFARTPEQENMKKWGFTPVEEQRVKDLTYSVNQDDKEMKGRRDNDVNKAFDALVRHDDKDFQKAKEYFVAFNGDPDDFLNGLLNEAFKAKVSREQLLAIKTNPNIPTLQKLRQLQQLMGSIR